MDNHQTETAKCEMAQTAHQVAVVNALDVLVKAGTRIKLCGLLVGRRAVGTRLVPIPVMELFQVTLQIDLQLERSPASWAEMIWRSAVAMLLLSMQLQVAWSREHLIAIFTVVLGF